MSIFHRSNEEWFEITDVEDIESDEPLYCIAVSSPTKQFLITDEHIPTHNTDEAKEANAMKEESGMLVGSIARLGRAAGVHLVVATQRPDATLLPGEVKANMAVRIGCGSLNSQTSSMILEDAEGTRVKANPRGRMYVKIVGGGGNHGQGFFAKPEFIDEYLDKKGLNQDGTRKDGKVVEKKVDDENLFEESEGGAPHVGLSDEQKEVLANDETLAMDSFDSAEGEKSKHNFVADWDDELDALIQENNE